MAYETDTSEQREIERFKQAVAKKIREHRINLGRSQEDVAGAQVSSKTYARIERGESSPNLNTLFWISRNLNVHPKEFFEIDFPLEKEGRRKRT